MFKISPRRVLFSSLFVIGLSTSVYAAQPAVSGLGQAWPNVTDVSANTHWHVYVFLRDGIQYIQVNDLNGNVRGAIAVSNGSFLVLPIGLDSSKFSVPQSVGATAAVDCHDPIECSTHRQSAGALVYQTSSVQVYAAPQSDGSVQLNAVSVDCHDPIECSTHRQQQVSTGIQASAVIGTSSGVSANVDCHDPIECSTHFQQQVNTAAQSRAGIGASSAMKGNVSVDCHDPIECSTH